jgi:hypothetical protein
MGCDEPELARASTCPMSPRSPLVDLAVTELAGACVALPRLWSSHLQSSLAPPHHPLPSPSQLGRSYARRGLVGAGRFRAWPELAEASINSIPRKKKINKWITKENNNGEGLKKIKNGQDMKKQYMELFFAKLQPNVVMPRRPGPFLSDRRSNDLKIWY